MNTGFSVLVALLLSLFHHGNVAATTQADVSADVTPTVTATVTPTDTPTDTPTQTITPTVTPDVTVTPTVTPRVSVTPEGKDDGDKDDMLGLKADAHALFGLMNAALHHESNEDRFNSKHGVRVESETEVETGK